MKEAYYFSHDANAQHDPKIIKMLSKMGWQGYGLYWALVERLRNEPDYSMPTDYDCIAYALRTDTKSIKGLIEGYGLFELNNGSFYSVSLSKRMKIKDERSQKARESALKRWKPSANGMRTHSEPNAIKESKVKEKKVKEDSTFEKFWNMYDKKVGDKNKVKKKWYSIGSNERLEVFATLPAFMKQFTDKQFQPYPMTYLNQQRWKDEYIIEHIDKSEFKRDTYDSTYIGYCEKCNVSDFYKTVEEDSRCCKTKILPKRQVNVRS